MLKVERKKLIRWGERIVILLLVLGFFWQWFPTGIKKPDSIKDVLKPPEAEARYQWDPSGGSIVTGSDYPVQDALANTPSYRALFSDDAWYWVTKFDTASGLDKRANIDGVRLQGANKMIITYGGYVSAAAGTNLVQIYDNVNTTWRTLNWRDAAFVVVTDTNYTFEIYNGYWQSGGESIDTPLSNFVSNDSNKRVQIRVYSTVTGRAIVHYWDRLNIEVAIGPLVYANSLTRLNGWTGTITNNYTWTNYSDSQYLIATNQVATSTDFYLSFQNVQTYAGANTIFVHHRGMASNAALTHQLQIYNFTTLGWENLNATLLSNIGVTDYYFAKNNVDLTNYVSSGEVRIRYYTTTLNTYTLSIDLVYITIGSTNNDDTQCQVSFGAEAGGTTCANARTIDTSSADSTWQQTTAKTAVAGFYPGDYGGTWNTNYSASANLWVPITIPSNAAVTGIEYIARFRSNSTANTMMPCLKDMSGLNPSVGGTGYAATGGWVDVSVSNALTTYTNLNPYTYTHYTSPEDFIDTQNNRANFRMRTSASTATASVTRDWDFAMVSIKWLQDDTVSANNPQYVGTSGSLEVGTAVAVGATNSASSTATFYSDNYYWQNQNLTSGTDRLDVRVNIDGVNLNNANKMIITYEGLVSNAALTYYVQIYDNASSTWRTLNDREVALASASEASYYFSIFNGFWNTGNDPIDTPLSNFITADSDKRVQIRIYSNAAIGTAYIHSLDRIQIEVATDPVYWAKDFERTQGTGTITNTYKFTHPAATLAITTGGSDNLRLTVANSNPAAQFYLDFGNIQTYTGANAIMVYYEGSTSVAASTYRLKIYNFTTPGWEDLTTTSMNNTTETAYQFAKAPITITDYIDPVNNVIRIGFDALTTTAGNIVIDYIYVTVGTVISAEGNAEVTIGQTAGGSSPLNSQSLDTTLASPSAWGIQTSVATDNPYAQDYAGLINVNQQATANINFGPALSNTAGVTGIRYAMRMLTTSSYLTWQGYLQDYSGLTGVVGGWLLVGTTNASAATYTFTEGWQELTFRNAEDFLDTFNNKVNLKMKPTATTQGTQITPNWDFAFVSIRWYENSANSYYNYQFSPTGGSLPTGADFPVQQAIQNVGSYKALFTTDNQWWVIKNDVSNGMDVRVNLDYVLLSSQTNKLFITFESQVSAAAGTFYLQIYDNASSTWRTVTDREAVIGATTETTYSYEIFNGRWQSGGVPIDTPLSNFVTSDSLKRMQFRIYSTVTGQAFAVYVDRLLLEIGTDSLYWAANKSISVGAASNNYAYTYTSDNNKFSVANTAGQSFDYDLSFKNILTYDGANAIFVAYEGMTSVATMTYQLKIWNFTANGGAGQWEDLTPTAMANTADATYYFAKGPVTLSNYISGGEARIGFYTPTIISGTHSIDYLYIMVGSVIDDAANSEISFGSEEGGSSVLNTQSIDTTLTLGSENNWGIITALTAANPYPGDYAGTYGTNDNGAANISFPVTQPSGTKITGIRYVARYLSNHANNTIEYAIRDYSGWLGTTGGYVDPGSVSNAVTTYSIYTYRYTNNPEDFVNTATNKMNIKIRTTASTDSTTVTYRWDFAFVSISWRVDEDHGSWSNQLYPTGGSLEVGTSPVVSSTNYGTYRATWASDDGRWQNQNLTSGTDRLDVRVNIDGVNLNNANKMIITYEGLVSNAALTYYVQIYDNASSTWRTLNDREVALASASEASYYFSIFNGFWNTGNDPIDTPLSNFITADSDKRVQIRIYSNAAIGTAYIHSLDRILLEVVTSPVYWAKDFERTQGTGTITNTYKFTHPAATLAATTGGDDDVELSVANILGESFDYYFTFGNIQTYTGANAILVYQESRSSVATLTYRLKIYNFTTPGWEDLTTTNINATAADTVYQFAKAPVNLSDYISGNELRIGYYTSATVSGTHYVDYIYVTIGTVIFDTSDAETSFGSSDGSSVLNTQDLDTTLASPNVYGINTASTATSHYANDYTPGLYNVAQAGAVNITFRAAVPDGAFITGYRFAARYRSNSTLMTVRSGTFDYAGLTGTTGGWYEQGTANTLASYTYTEGWHHATDNNVEDFTANYQKKFNMRLRTTASTLSDQVIMGLDFFFIAVRFAGAANLSQNYYRWYANEDNVTPSDPWPTGGTDLGENTAITASDSPPGIGTVLRARISIRVQAQDLAANSQDFKLQFATSTNCVSVPWDQWSDVVATSSCSGSDPWCGYDNATSSDGATLPSTLLSVSDVAETYEESNPSALNPNSATVGQDIEYDWVIKNNNAPIETSYCFRMAKSDGDPLSAYNNYPKLVTGVVNPAPVVSNIQLNGQTAIDLMENSTSSVSATANISDAQGCSTITNVSAKIYRSGVSGAEACTANENNCYSVASCTQNSCVGNDATYTCTIDMQFDADPTDANTPWTSEYWRAYIEATDGSLTGSGYSPADAPDVNSLLALEATGSINYGSLTPGQKNDPLDKITTVTATGNVSLDVTLYGTNMCTDYPTCSGSTMAVGKQKYALSSSTAYSSGNSLLVDPGAEAELNCSKTTDSSNKQTKDIWWGIEIPNPQAGGSYTGQNTFIGVKNETPWP